MIGENERTEAAMTWTYKERAGETGIICCNTLQSLDMFVRQSKLKSLNVAQKLFRLAPANDRKDERRLVHQVCNSDCKFILGK